MRTRILIVDDDEQYVAGLREWLEGAGYETISAHTVHHAERAVRERAPHLVILDIRVGHLNGLQLIAAGDLTIPVIVITGFDDRVLRADAEAFGAMYLVKPIEPRSLLAMIEQELGSVSEKA